MKKNINKQEAVVGIIWEFAANQRNIQHDCTNSKGVSVHYDSVVKALEDIMHLFNYEVTEVQ